MRIRIRDEPLVWLGWRVGFGFKSDQPKPPLPKKIKIKGKFPTWREVYK